MKSTALLLLFCLFSTIVFSQNENIIKFGKANLAELEMKYYKKDSSAEAVLLYELGEIEFGYDELSGLKTIFSYYAKYKILKKSGMDKGLIKLPYIQGSYDEKEIIRNVEGYTHNLQDGKIISTKLTKESIFDEHILDNNYQKKISMPNLKEGTIFEYRYIRETPFKVRDKPKTWFFQGNIPFQWSELIVTIPSYFNYKMLAGGYLKFFIKEKYDKLVSLIPNLDTYANQYRYVVKNAPAFHEEPFITSNIDYISRIEFELAGVTFPNDHVNRFTETWENLAKTLLSTKHYTEGLKKTNYLKSAIATILPISDSMQRINAAFEFVSKNMKWNELNSVYAREDVEKVYGNKMGGATELNLMLIALLQGLGFDASPVILSTRNNGKISQAYPMLDQFNYTIACVSFNGKDLLMDATDPFTKPGLLPKRCLNGTGRLIKERNSRFVSLNPTEKAVSFKVINAVIESELGTVTGTCAVSYAGYDAHSLRIILKEEGEDKLTKNIKKAHAEWEIENIKIENKEDVTESLKIAYGFKYTDNVTDNAIYFNPMLSEKLESNPFKEAERIYPIDMAVASDEIYKASIKLPPGYIVEEIPKSVSISLPDNSGKFTYAIEVNNGVISISSRIILNEFYFSADQYPSLKEFYTLIVQKHAEQIILKKMN